MNGVRIEASLISAIVNSGDLLTVLDAGYEASDFSEYPHIFSWLVGYYKRTKKTPVPALLKVRYKFSVHADDDLTGAISEFNEYRTKQALLSIMQDAIEQLDNGADVAALSDDMRKALSGAHTRSAGSAHQSSVLADWKGTYSMVASRRMMAQTHHGISGIPTGWETLDAATGGFHENEYWIYAARLGGGKTWSLIRTACAVLATGGTVLYFGLEQPRAQLTMRFHAFLSAMYGPVQFPASDLTQGRNYDLKAYKGFVSSLTGMCPGTLIINDTPRRKLKPTMLSAQIERLRPSLTIIDYIGLMVERPGDYTSVMDLSADIKGIAGEYSTTVVAAAQLNRTATSTTRAADADALAGSDSLGQDADGLVTLVKTSDHTRLMKLAKYRHGQDGMSWYNRYDVNVGIFDECSESDFLDLRDLDTVNGGGVV